MNRCPQLSMSFLVPAPGNLKTTQTATVNFVGARSGFSLRTLALVIAPQRPIGFTRLPKFKYPTLTPLSVCVGSVRKNTTPTGMPSGPTTMQASCDQVLATFIFRRNCSEVTCGSK